ncbi:MAG TPA: MFS transporter [Candidatus Acidoferrum sp.]|jgi:fucose permease
MNSHSTESNLRPSGLLVFAMLFVGFVITGVANTFFGPSLPVFIARWKLDDAQAGLFFTIVFLGSLAGVGLSSLLISTRGYRWALVSGFVLMAAGMAALNTNREALALCATATIGCGFGMVVPATNLFVAEAAGQSRAAALNLLNLAWGLGAISCPPLIFAAIKGSFFSALLYGFAAVAGLIGLVVLGTFPSITDVAIDLAVSNEDLVKAPLLAAIALGALFFVYVGTETGLSGWVAAYARRSGTMRGTLWTLVPMFFWAGLLGGRGLAPIFLRIWKEFHLVVCGLIAAIFGAAILLRGSSPATIIIGVFIGGLGLSMVYPIFIAWLAKWYGSRAPKIGGPIFALASLGGATLPWAVGFVSTEIGSLRIGLLVPVLGCFVMLGILAGLRRRRLL